MQISSHLDSVTKLALTILNVMSIRKVLATVSAIHKVGSNLSGNAIANSIFAPWEDLVILLVIYICCRW